MKLTTEEEFEKGEIIKKRFIKLIENTRLTRKRLIDYLKAEIKSIEEDMELDKN